MGLRPGPSYRIEHSFSKVEMERSPKRDVRGHSGEDVAWPWPGQHVFLDRNRAIGRSARVSKPALSPSAIFVRATLTATHREEGRVQYDPFASAKRR